MAYKVDNDTQISVNTDTEIVTIRQRDYGTSNINTIRIGITELQDFLATLEQ